jgi:hypothetical protein
MSQGDYLLLNSASELERLRIQARVWEPETEAWLDASARWKAGIASIWVAGPMGILGPLARRAGRLGASWAWTSTLCSFAARAPYTCVCVFNGSSLHLSTTLRRRYGTARPVRPCEPADRTLRRHLR